MHPTLRISNRFTALSIRAGERAELGLQYSTHDGYALIYCNLPASRLFSLDVLCIAQHPLPWVLFPMPLKDYLTEMLDAAAESPDAPPPAFVHPSYGNLERYDVTLFQDAPIATGVDEEQQHLLLLHLELSRNPQPETAKVLEASKLENIGELASGVAHDFNNLIMGIQGNAQLMLSDNRLNEADRDRSINIIRACTAGVSLTKSLLGYAKRQSLEIARFDIVHLVKDVASLIGISLGSRFRLTLTPPLGQEHRTLPAIGCYSSLSHCLLNLIKNSRDAMPNGGNIIISWRGDDQTAHLVVADDGPGIAPEHLPHIFQPFYTTKKQGTGLGLAMAQSILAQHGGEMRLESSPGKGTQVSLIWPRGDISSDTVPVTEFRRSTTKIRIDGLALRPQHTAEVAFLLDDDEMICTVVAHMLKMLGFEVRTFTKAEEVFEILNPNAMPRLVVTDYHMTGMDGTEFLRYWHQELPALYRESPVHFVLISGHPTSHFDEWRTRCPDIEVTLLQKPFTFEELSAAVQDTPEKFVAKKPERPGMWNTLMRKATSFVPTADQT